MTRKTFLNYYSFLIIHIHAIIIATLHIEKGLTKRAIHASRNIKLRGKNRTHVSKTEREEKKKKFGVKNRRVVKERLKIGSRKVCNELIQG